MARGPSPGTASGHLGEARRTVAAGPRQPRIKAREERFIYGLSGSFMGGFLLHSRSGRCSNGHHQIGGSLLTVGLVRGAR
jgi:hypothetical protein